MASAFMPCVSKVLVLATSIFSILSCIYSRACMTVQICHVQKGARTLALGPYVSLG